MTVAWVLGVGGVWVDGGLGFGLGVVVEPWVWVAVGLPWVWVGVWVDGGLGFGLGVVVEPWVWVTVGLPWYGLPWVLSTVKKIEMRREKRKMKREKKS